MVSYSEYLDYCRRTALKNKKPIPFVNWKKFKLNQKVVDIAA